MNPDDNLLYLDQLRKRRLDMLQELRWTHCALPEHVQSNVTPQEIEFFKNYSRNLGIYMRSRDLNGIGLDLTAVSEIR